MPSRPCCARGCPRVTTPDGYGDYCPKHARHYRRHGHPEQDPLTKGEVTRLKKYVTKLIDRRRNSPEIWDKLDSSHRALLSDLRAESLTTKVVYRGNRHKFMLLHAMEAAEAKDFILTALAISYLHEYDSRRFKSDEAFFVSLARRILMFNRTSWSGRLTPVERKDGSRTLWKTQTYRDPARYYSSEVGKMVAKVFYPPGVALRQGEIRTDKMTADVLRAPVEALTLDA